MLVEHLQEHLINISILLFRGLSPPTWFPNPTGGLLKSFSEFLFSLSNGIRMNGVKFTHFTNTMPPEAFGLNRGKTPAIFF